MTTPRKRTITRWVVVEYVDETNVPQMVAYRSKLEASIRHSKSPYADKHLVELKIALPPKPKKRKAKAAINGGREKI